MRIPLLACLSLATTPALAGTEEALSDHILPGFAGFATAAEALSVTAKANCTAEALKEPWNAAFDAWTQVGDLRMGPTETGALPVYFWPDARGFTPRTLGRLIDDEEPIGTDPETFSEISIAARGLMALEQMLYEDDLSGYAQGSYSCALVQTMATDLSAQAGALEAGWRDGFAQVLRSAGQEGNALFQTPDEALRGLYTQVLSSLEFTADTRLGRPLGTFERPRPTRAEAWRSGRALGNAVLFADAAADLAITLADTPMPQTRDALDRLHEVADRVTDPALQDIDDPSARLRVEIVQQQVHTLSQTIEAELGGLYQTFQP